MADTLKTRILRLLSERPGLSDREITDVLLGTQVGQQAVNQACRALADAGILTREKMPRGFIGNFLRDGTGPTDMGSIPPAISVVLSETPGDLSEDEVKSSLNDWLRSMGWIPNIAWGRTRGIDIDAQRNGQRWIIEVNGSGSLQPMRVNYFVAILGEILQRMSDPDAKYSIALPDLAQYRGLWDRFPSLARERTGVSALFVDRSGSVTEAV